MTTILICGGDSWANRGDAAILAGTLASLSECLPGVRLLVASDQPLRTAQQEDVTVVARRRPGAMLSALREADLMLWGGGQLLQNASSKPFLLAQLALVQTAHALGTPVMGFAQGAGPIDGGLSRLAARRVVDGSRCFTVRDTLSASALRSLGVVRTPIEVTADPALLITPASTERAASLVEAAGVCGPFVVFAPRQWGHYTGGWLPVGMARRGQGPEPSSWFAGILRDLAAAADHVIGNLRMDVLFMPMCPGGDQHDELVAAAVQARMRHAGRSHIFRSDCDSQDLAAVLGLAEALVAIRMHPIILASLSGVLGIAISYQGKGAAFQQRLGLDRYALPINQVTADDLIGRLDSLLAEKAALYETVATRVRALQQAARRNAEIAASLLSSLRRSKRPSASSVPFAGGAATGERIVGANLVFASGLGRGRTQDSPLPIRGLLLRQVDTSPKASATGAVRRPPGPARLGSYYRRLMLNSLGIRPGPGLVLDVGGHDGSVLSPEPAGARIVGLDPEPASGGGANQMVRGDGRTPPFRPGAFLTVYALDVLEHVEDDHILATALVDLLAPDGTLWVTVPHEGFRAVPPFVTGMLHRRWGHVRRGYSACQLMELFGQDVEMHIREWNEPAFRLVYLPARLMWRTFPAAAKLLLRVAARFDARWQRGQSGHLVARIVRRVTDGE